MSIRSTVAGQIADYPRVHAARANLAIHMAAIPLFWAGLAALAVAAAALSVFAAFGGIAALFVSIGLQAWGHKREKETPEPFSSPLNFLIRITTESLIVYPRYVLTGGWAKAWRAS